ncbi:MAG TPA: ornithine carbamoyltransferase [Candidatus Cloacimonetes bacterium]|nr:ornithine carbamoyltransferase [Candidatus Cloacimonadota bacterium]HEX37728.1 ornithine carbamoyltransferase [Candidatus Cloacimonadota bacterium]
MTVKLKGRSLLTLKDYSKKEILFLIDSAIELKEHKAHGTLTKKLQDKNIALLFEKSSTRTRCAFVTAAVNEGAHTEFLGKNDIQFGNKESVEDTARVLGRMFDGIEFRGFKQETVDLLAEYSGVPVWNGLTDLYHPTQILADFMTVKEELGFLEDVKIAFVGDGRNNVANSLMIGAAKLGMDFRIISPKLLYPRQNLVDECKAYAKESGARIKITDSIPDGVKDCDVIYTDIWASMGEEDKIPERISMLKPYKITQEMLKKTGNDDIIFLHCLPSFHNLKTEMAQKFPDICEVEDEVFESNSSKVFDQAENRLWTIEAVMVATLT